MSHGITKCRACSEIVLQCRCMDHRNIKWIEKCDKCKVIKEPSYGPQAHNSFKNMKPTYVQNIIPITVAELKKWLELKNPDAQVFHIVIR